MLTIDLDEHFINVKGIAISPVLTLQAAGIDGPKFYAPETDGFSGNDNPAFSQEILNIPVAKIEAIVVPDGVGNDIWRESVTSVGIHWPILAIPAT